VRAVEGKGRERRGGEGEREREGRRGP